MAKVNGQMVTCDRCGASIFLKCTGEGERDGGFTRWNEFDTLPPGWEIVEIPGNKYIQTCPSCTKLWVDALTEHFLKKED